MDNILIGFIFKNGENDFSLINPDLPDEDRVAIEAILNKHINSGCSVRGNANLQIKEVV